MYCENNQKNSKIGSIRKKCRYYCGMINSDRVVDAAYSGSFFYSGAEFFVKSYLNLLYPALQCIVDFMINIFFVLENF